MRLRRDAPNVYYATESISRLDASAISLLVAEARQSERRRARICLHRGDDDPVHEMVICLCQESYVPPHLHYKPESVHLLEGVGRLIVFDDHGTVTEVIPLDADSPAQRYVHLQPGIWHTLLVDTEYLLFHETTRGPFRRDDSRFATWAPAENSVEVPSFLQSVRMAAGSAKCDG